MVIVEKSFPRGGAGKKESVRTKDIKENIVFGAQQKKLRKSKSRAKDDSAPDDEDVRQRVASAELLSYATIQEGMHIMGKIKKVDQLNLTISLPGRITARVSVLEISDAYISATKEFLRNVDQAENYKPLQDLYRVGQIVYGRVLEVIKKGEHDGRPHIKMTLKPASVHGELSHMSLKKGFIFNGAIEEIQEHGYIIETGIRNLRAFVPLDKSQRGHAVGELVYFKVTKMTQDKAASTCICKEVKLADLKIKDQSEPNIDYILPGTMVQFEVTQRLKDGLQGTLMNGAFNGYINEHQLTEPLALPEDFDVGKLLWARVLYVMPLTKFVYLTLNLRDTDEVNEAAGGEVAPGPTIAPLQRGDVVENAKVHHLGTGGVVLVLRNKFKGIISYGSIKANRKGNYDQNELMLKYTKQSKHTVRILGYDLMDALYICSDDASIIAEKHFDLRDLQPGAFVTASVVQRNPKIGGYTMQIGKLKGIIEQLFLAPSSKPLEDQTKLRCRIVSVNAERKSVYLTNRPEYLAKGSKVLVGLDDAKPNAIYTGTVVKCDQADGYLLVRFFNDLKGVLHKQRLQGLIAGGGDLIDTFYAGQTMPFRIVGRKQEQILLTLADDTFSLGEICPVTVAHKLDSGLEIKITYDASSTGTDMQPNDSDDEREPIEINGLVPLRFLSDFSDLLHARLRTYRDQAALQAVCLTRNIFSVRDVPYFSENVTKEWASVHVGDLLRAYVKSVSGDIAELWLPIRGYGKLVKVHLQMLLASAHNGHAGNITLTPEQVVYVRVLAKEQVTRTLSISAKLLDVWDGDLRSTAQLVEQYLTEVADIQRLFKKQGRPIAKYKIGDRIDVVFEGVDAVTGDWQYTVADSQISAIVKATTAGRAKMPPVGATQPSIVLWVDYSDERLVVSNKTADLTHFTADTQLPVNLAGKSGVNAKVLLRLEQLVICSLKKGPNPLVYCATRLHYNDFEGAGGEGGRLKEGDFCKLAFVYDSKCIAVLDGTWKLWHDAARHKRKAQEQLQEKIAKKKAKMAAEEKKPAAHTTPKQPGEKPATTKPVVKTQLRVQSKAQAKRKRSAKIGDEDESNALLFYEDKGPQQVTTTPLPPCPKKPTIRQRTLPGVEGFWNTDLTQVLANDSDEAGVVISCDEASSDATEDSDAADGTSRTTKKKKLSAVQKFKLQRDEETRLCAIETRNADTNRVPDSVDQFDRLVMAQPNDSSNWIRYMAFHLEAAEIEKARAVGQRAIKAISFREAEDRLNVWMALLNVELRYGSNKDQYDDTLKEALTYNDPLRVYLRLIDILGDAERTQELVELIGLLGKKFKAEPDMWKAAANAYFRIGMAERAQQLLHRALACLPDREHVNMIVSFANLNQKHGQSEMAQTLLDQVITSYPKRVDVWTQYVDVLVKSGLNDSARTVLERAVIQKLPLKKMRTIFKKYLEFEERFGDATSVHKVKALAADYVKNNTQL